MAATGKTPILLYGSTTASNVPTAGNLTNSSDGCEIAINVADKNLFFKDATNAVNTVPIRQSSASSNGWLSSTDWSTFNSKQPAGTYVTSVTGTAPVVSSGGTTPAISMAAANGSTNGYLTSTDWTTFNNKVSSQWTTSGSNIYLASGNAGIGMTPSAWRSNRQVLQIGNNTSACLSLASSIGEIANNFYYDSSGTPKYITTGYAGCMSFNLQTTGGYTWLLASSGSAGATVTAPTVMELDASGNLKINTGNLVIGTSGKGIDFSVTSDGSGTATSELLADYEEGTFTPVLKGNTSAGTGTYTTQSGSYTKIGNRVFFSLYLTWSAHTGTGYMIVDGLPYTIANNNANYVSVSTYMDTAIALTAGKIMQTRTIINSTQLLPTQYATGGSGIGTITITSTGGFILSGYYYV